MDPLKQKKTRRAAVPRMEDLIPHEVKRTEVMRRLYNNDSLLGEKGIFTEMLQSMINAALEGEMDYTLRSEGDSEFSNRRNGHTQKKVRSPAGTLDIYPARDRAGVHQPTILKKWKRELARRHG